VRQDASDKRYCVCDDTLKQLTGEKRFMLFGSQKYFKKHMLG
jgi:chromatin remodeling complex protein RSC6